MNKVVNKAKRNTECAKKEAPIPIYGPVNGVMQRLFTPAQAARVLRVDRNYVYRPKAKEKAIA